MTNISYTCASTSLVLHKTRVMLLEHVRGVSKGAAVKLPVGARHVALHSLAGRNGLRLLLRVVHPAAARSAASRRALVPAQPQ